MRKCKWSNQDHVLVGAVLDPSWAAEGPCLNCSRKIHFGDRCGYCPKCNRYDNRHNDDMPDERRAYDGAHWWCGHCCNQTGETSDQDWDYHYSNEPSSGSGHYQQHYSGRSETNASYSNWRGKPKWNPKKKQKARQW